MASRRVPVHRGGGAKSGGGRRAAPHPGTGGAGGSSPEDSFVSPFQPPPGALDRIGDISSSVRDGWQMVRDTHGGVWRLRAPQSVELHTLAEALATKGRQQIMAVNRYMAAHMHPDDLGVLLNRLVDPDDPLDDADYMSIWKSAVEVGGARPFRL